MASLLVGVVWMVCAVVASHADGAPDAEATACGVCLLACHESSFAIESDQFNDCVKACDCARPEEEAATQMEETSEETVVHDGAVSTTCAKCLEACFTEFFNDEDSSLFKSCTEQCACKNAVSAAVSVLDKDDEENTKDTQEATAVDAKVEADPAAHADQDVLKDAHDNDADKVQAKEQAKEEAKEEAKDQTKDQTKDDDEGVDEGRQDILQLSAKDCAAVTAEMAERPQLAVDLVYQGCYAAAPYPNRRLRKLGVASESAMTPALCKYFCFHAGFALMGLEDGDTCLCDKATHPLEVVAATDAEGPAATCASLCTGNPEQRCGGVARTAVWAIVEQEVAATAAQDTDDKSGDAQPVAKDAAALAAPHVSSSAAVALILKGRGKTNPVTAVPIEHALYLLVAALASSGCFFLVHLCRSRRKRLQEEYVRTRTVNLRRAGYEPLGSIRTTYY